MGGPEREEAVPSTSSLYTLYSLKPPFKTAPCLLSYTGAKCLIARQAISEKNTFVATRRNIPNNTFDNVQLVPRSSSGGTKGPSPFRYSCGEIMLILQFSDTLRRHMQNIHGMNEMPDIKHACAHCRKQKSRCQGGPPCKNCLRRGIHCSLERRVGAQQVDHRRDIARMSELPPIQPAKHDSDQEKHFISIYFNTFHPRWPFVHRGSFNDHEAPLLIKSMLVIGLWLSKERKARSKAIDLHNVLGSAIRQQTVRRKLSPDHNSAS